ncbi:TonB-dependent receptor [Parasphingorhabdus sp.]|uniref:TonB-dependent receptor n=1 Tax=Parasphingorhabdus sp. TaxID=2709688 RepID=UPI002F940393
MKASVLKTFTSVMAITWAGAAYAQDAPSAADEAAQDTVGSKEIIVTAQRRSERLVDVPISVSVASADDLERAGPESLENLTKVTPGVYLQRSSYGLSPTIRGIGSTLSTSSGEQNVGLYVDEIYYPTPTGNVFDLASVESVQILKGPQGTLFGRNATGGAILVRTLDPGFDVSGRFNLSYERFNQIRSSAYVNVPLTDKIAVNGSLAYRYSDGYVRDLRTNGKTNQAESFAARGKLLMEPTDNLSVVLTAAHTELSDPTGTDTRNLQPALLLVALSGGPIATDRYDSSSATDQLLKTEMDDYSVRARLELDAGTISSFTAWLRNDLYAVSDLTGSYLPFNVALSTYTNTFSQEVNFASRQNRPLTYVAGVYYFKNKGGLPFISQNDAPLFFNLYDDWSVSGYADGTYTFGDLSLIAGIRYTYEKIAADSGFGTTQATGTVTRFQRDSDSQWTPRLGLRYALGDQSNLYATYTKGFKSGRFDRSSPTGPGVDAEKVDAFEVGFKYASGDISFNAAAYYYDYDDTQVNATITTPGGAIVTQLFNVPRSRIYGGEADVSLRLNDNFDLRAAAAYTHARYLDFPSAPGYVLDPADPATLGGLLFSNISLDASGNHMVRAPEFTASGSIAYHTPIGGNSELEIVLSPYYSSRVYYTFDNSLSQKPYFTLDGTVTLTVDEKMEVSIFGRNLTDSKHQIGAAQSAFSLEMVAFAKPRTFGVSLGYSF